MLQAGGNKLTWPGVIALAFLPLNGLPMELTLQATGNGNILCLPACCHFPKLSAVLIYSHRGQARSSSLSCPKSQKAFLAPGDCVQAVFGLELLSPQAEIAGEQKIWQDQVRELDEMSKSQPRLCCSSSWG